MNGRRVVARTDGSGVSHQHDAVSKERLDEWLDDALADTFPASDPVASPPSDAAPMHNDLPGPNRVPAGAPTSQRSRR
jgi:hypothetical protein